jgi:predicted membrane channel-forming protein YqfA (hemolysin III family)
MKNFNFLHKRVSYLAISLMIIGALLNIQHWNYAKSLLRIGTASLGICALVSIVIVVTDKKESITQKIVWLIFLILFMPIGLNFYFSWRKRVEAGNTEEDND